MTPKEKAKDLLNKYYSDKCFNGNYAEDYNAKQCALIAVDEILKAVTTIADKKYDYFIKVKQEIEKL